MKIIKFYQYLLMEPKKHFVLAHIAGSFVIIQKTSVEDGEGDK